MIINEQEEQKSVERLKLPFIAVRNTNLRHQIVQQKVPVFKFNAPIIRRYRWKLGVESTLDIPFIYYT